MTDAIQKAREPVAWEVWKGGKRVGDPVYRDITSDDRYAGYYTKPLYSATALERVVRERDEALKARDFYEQRSLENNMLAHKWMAAHDALHAGRPYKFPAPVDLPDALARAESAESKLAEARKVIEDTRTIVCDGAAEGFNPLAGDWAERLYTNNGALSKVIGPRRWIDIARLSAEITTLRARLETVEAETRERCAKVADKVAESDFARDDERGDFVIDKGTAAFIASLFRNLEPRHD